MLCPYQRCSVNWGAQIAAPQSPCLFTGINERWRKSKEKTNVYISTVNTDMQYGLDWPKTRKKKKKMKWYLYDGVKIRERRRANTGDLWREKSVREESHQKCIFKITSVLTRELGDGIMFKGIKLFRRNY